MTETKLLSSISELLTKKQLYQNAGQMKMLIDKENGLLHAVEEIEGVMGKGALL